LKVIQIIARLIFILCLPLLFLSASLAWGFNSQWIFTYGFQKYDVSQTTGLSNEELKTIPPSWVNYINSGEEYWHITLTQDGKSFELFTAEEQSHFKDVKQLIQMDYRVLLVTALLVLAYSLTSIIWRKGKYWRQFARSVIWGSGLTVVLIVVLGVASLLDFNQLFIQLHYILFTNTTWSAQGYMLLLFPGDFWFDAALFSIAFMAGLAIIGGAIAFVCLKLNLKKSLDAIK
jgi:integral membrane protein (TIGR01906 family)